MVEAFVQGFFNVFHPMAFVLVIVGMLTLPRSRLRAYALFRLAILVAIFLTQVFSFYRQQFVALLGLVIDIIILVALRYLIRHESEKTHRPQPTQLPH